MKWDTEIQKNPRSREGLCTWGKILYDTASPRAERIIMLIIIAPAATIATVRRLEKITVAREQVVTLLS